MGQNSSKRGSYTPGRDFNDQDASSPVGHGDIRISGSFEALNSPGSASGGADSSVHLRGATLTPSGSAEKKDKRKRFKVPSFSIGRTPSGRWRRKKRSAPNGRPVSMPVYLNDDDEEEPNSRPQSLFLEELDVEEGERIETVDLSDDELAEKHKSGLAIKGASKGKTPQKKLDKKKKREKPPSKKEKKKSKSKLEIDINPGNITPSHTTSPSISKQAQSGSNLSLSAHKPTAKYSLQDPSASLTSSSPSVPATEISSKLSGEAKLEGLASSIVKQSVTKAQLQVEQESLHATSPSVTGQLSLHSPTVSHDVHTPHYDLNKTGKIKVKTPSSGIEYAEEITAKLMEDPIEFPPFEEELMDGKKLKLTSKAKIPSLDIQTEQKVGKFDMPNFQAGISAPKMSNSEINAAISVPNVPSAEVNLPDIDVPKIKSPDVHVGGKLPSADVSAPNVNVGISAPKLPSADVNLHGISALKGAAPKVHGPDVHLGGKLPSADIDLPNVDADISVPKLPSGDINISGGLPGLKGKTPKIHGPDIHTDAKFSTPGIDIPDVKGKISGPKLPSAQVDIPDISGSFDVPKIKSPDIHAGGKLPSANVSGPNVNADLSLPSADVNLSGLSGLKGSIPKVHGPDVHIGGKLPSADASIPNVSAGISGPKLPSAGVKTKVDAPKVKSPDVNINDPKIHLGGKLPSADASGPSVNVGLSKSSKKGKVSNRLSNWFHKKEKGMKTSPTVEIDQPFSGDIADPSLSSQVKLDADVSLYPLDSSPGFKTGLQQPNLKATPGSFSMNAAPRNTIEINASQGRHLSADGPSSEKSLGLNTAVFDISSPSASIDVNSNMKPLKVSSKGVKVKAKKNSPNLPHNHPTLDALVKSTAITLNASSHDNDSGVKSREASISDTEHDTGDLDKSSGKLKKISLGSRLKTAILRKKSSEDSQRPYMEHSVPLSLTGQSPDLRVDAGCQCDDPSQDWSWGDPLDESTGSYSGEMATAADLSSIKLDIPKELNSGGKLEGSLSAGHHSDEEKDASDSDDSNHSHSFHVNFSKK